MEYVSTHTELFSVSASWALSQSMGKISMKKLSVRLEKVMVIHKISTFVLPLTLSQVPFTDIPIPPDFQQASGENPCGYNTEDKGCQLSRPHHISGIIPVWQW